MLALKIIGAVVLVIALLMLIRVGCRIEYSAEGFFLWLKIAGFKFLILPKKSLTPEQEAQKAEKDKAKKAEQKAKKLAKKQTAEEAKARGEKPARKKPGELLWLLQFLRPAFHALNQLRRKLRIDHMDITYAIGGAKDPSDAAVKYGQVAAGGGALFPLLNAALDIRDWSVDLGVDFTEEKTKVAVGANATYRIGQLLAIVCSLGMKALVIYLKHKKESNQEEEVKHAG